MGRKMERSKRSVLFEHLPGQTYDFERTGVIARTTHIRGRPNADLNLNLVIAAIEDEVRAWPPEQRRSFPNPLTTKANSFILIDPLSVSAEMFPRVFWCKKCGQIYDYTGDAKSSGVPASANCPKCKKGKLTQLRFVRVHRCGALLPLTPPLCRKCKSKANMALDTRGSERISNFRWICLKCNITSSVFGGSCPQCSWDTPIPNIRDPKTMSIEVHRAGSTFYAHHVTLLNQPGSKLSAFLGISEWPEIAAASYLEFPEIADKPLLDFVRYISPNSNGEVEFKLTDTDKADLRAKGYSDAKIEEFQQMQAQLRPKRRQEATPAIIATALTERTGVRREVWIGAGQDMLEAVLPMQTGNVRLLSDSTETGLNKAYNLAQRMGLDRVALIADFPITTATYGYSRVDYQPGKCFINPFPPDRDHGGKFPIFVDLLQADAVMLRLDADRVCRWLEANGWQVKLPRGTGQDPLRRQAYFVELFDNVQLRETISNSNPNVRMVFGLLHTLSHICVRRAALLCGLDRTSLNEYVLPRALSFAVYSSHRFGATIGALTALFEQSLAEWLTQVVDSRYCVYDPMCADQGGSCHACMHLAEISCQFFNLNLGRSFLFGGRDPELGEIRVGYFDPSLA